MTVQTSYELNQANAVPGLIGDIGFNEIDSFLAEGAVAFGYVVSRGTADNQAVPGGDGTGIGVAVRDLAREGAATTGAVSYADGDTMAVMRFGSGGKIFAELAAGGNAGDALHYVDATGVIDVGAAGAGQTDIVGATLEKDTVAGGVGLIRLG